jgi:hypothetical protein
LINIFTPYLARFELNCKSYLTTLDRGVVLSVTSSDNYVDLDSELIQKFRAVFPLSKCLTVTRENGFPAQMSDLQGLALNLAVLAVHTGLSNTVSSSLRKFCSGLPFKQEELKSQFEGGSYEVSDVLKPVSLGDQLRVVAKKEGFSVRFFASSKHELVSKVASLTADTSADNVKIYTPINIGTTVYETV